MCMTTASVQNSLLLIWLAGVTVTSSIIVTSVLSLVSLYSPHHGGRETGDIYSGLQNLPDTQPPCPSWSTSIYSSPSEYPSAAGSHREIWGEGKTQMMEGFSTWFCRFLKTPNGLPRWWSCFCDMGPLLKQNTLVSSLLRRQELTGLSGGESCKTQYVPSVTLLSVPSLESAENHSKRRLYSQSTCSPTARLSPCAPNLPFVKFLKLCM